MTEIVIPDIPPAPVVPPYPALGAPNFNQMAYAVGTQMPGVVSGLNAIALAARQCALAARADAQAVAAWVGVAQGAAGTSTTKAAEATASASASAAAQSGAIAAAGASLESAEDAAAAAGLANDAKGDAQAARDRSMELMGEVEGLRDETQALRNQAEIYATGQLKGSSATSVVPGAGAKSFAMEASRSFVAGMYLVATSVGDPATQMSGPVQSYDPATGALVIAVDKFAGAAARADWAIGIAARAGATALARQEVAASTVCVAGVEYIVVAPGITLTLPTNWRDNEEIAITEAIGNGAQYTLVFGGTKLRSQTMGTQVISAVFGSTGVLRHHNPAQGLV